MAIQHAYFFERNIKNGGSGYSINGEIIPSKEVKIDHNISTAKYNDEGYYTLSISVRGTTFREKDAATVEVITSFIIQRDNSTEYSAFDRKLIGELYHQAFCNCLDLLNYYCKNSQSGFALIEYYPIGTIYEDIRIGALEMPIF